VVNFATARLDVHHGAAVDAAGLAAAVARAGFSVRPAAGAPRVSWWRSPRAWRLLVAVPLFMAGLAGDLTDAPGQGAWTALLVIAAAVGGWAVFRSALAGVRSRSLDMNVLMAAATVGAGALGQWPEAASIVLLFSLGNLLQAHAIDRTRASVEALSQLTPEAVQVRRGAALATVLVDDVVVGDLVLVRPGDRVALDGTVEEGSTTVDESAITGEGAPVEKAAGDVVRSGSLNGAGALDVRVTAPAAGSTLQQVVRMVEQAQATKAPAEELVDSIARVYTPVVVLIAVALAVVPGLVTGDWSTWTYRALALLVIACPCSLVISTPVTVVSGIGAASRRGILVKGGSALAAAGRMRSIALDKTGTLTEGRPHVASTTVVADLAAGSVLGIAAALERRSGHPLAHALLTAAEGQRVLEATDVVGVAGRGARGLVDGVEYSIGSPRLFAELGIPQPPLVDGVVAELGDRGETPVLLGTAAGVVAVFGLADTVRPEAAGAIAALRAAGIEHITMLTGDSTGAAARVAGQLGVDYRAELLPADKVEAIRELQRSHGVVGMVGDGVNDAPALAEADVSFAMGAAGAGVALDAADVTLLQDDLRKLVAVVELSRRSRRVLAQNVVSSVVIKGAFVVLAPFGLVTLWLAVAADLGTSLAVTGNGLRLFRHRP
ncbi:MAG: Heavy metal translocating P-type ATPase, partial [Thermoleophilia bacterium]|nr:Heavy metal translocating P-type ATPase [Thermoleophilia bacterium]